MNMEFFEGKPHVGSTVFVQHGTQLSAYTVNDAQNFRDASPLGTIGVSRGFLALVVRSILSSESTVARLEGPKINLAFVDGLLTISDAGNRTLGVLSGGVLRSLAAFMAYWVDHDGVEVPSGLVIDYPHEARDDQGRTWTLNFAY